MQVNLNQKHNNLLTSQTFPVKLSDIPVEILLNILKRLDPSDLHAVTLVGKRFSILAQDPTLREARRKNLIKIMFKLDRIVPRVLNTFSDRLTGKYKIECLSKLGIAFRCRLKVMVDGGKLIYRGNLLFRPARGKGDAAGLWNRKLIRVAGDNERSFYIEKKSPFKLIIFNHATLHKPTVVNFLQILQEQGEAIQHPESLRGDGSSWAIEEANKFRSALIICIPLKDDLCATLCRNGLLILWDLSQENLEKPQIVKKITIKLSLSAGRAYNVGKYLITDDDIVDLYQFRIQPHAFPPTHKEVVKTNSKMLLVFTKNEMKEPRTLNCVLKSYFVKEGKLKLQWEYTVQPNFWKHPSESIQINNKWVVYQSSNGEEINGEEINVKCLHADTGVLFFESCFHLFKKMTLLDDFLIAFNDVGPNFDIICIPSKERTSLSLKQIPSNYCIHDVHLQDSILIIAATSSKEGVASPAGELIFFHYELHGSQLRQRLPHLHPNSGGIINT